MYILDLLKGRSLPRAETIETAMIFNVIYYLKMEILFHILNNNKKMEITSLSFALFLQKLYVGGNI